MVNSQQQTSLHSRKWSIREYGACVKKNKKTQKNVMSQISMSSETKFKERKVCKQNYLSPLLLHKQLLLRP